MPYDGVFGRCRPRCVAGARYCSLYARRPFDGRLCGSNTLNNVDKELKENREIINTLTENNEALNLRVNTLTNKINEKEEEFDNLTSDNNNLKAELNK